MEHAMSKLEPGSTKGILKPAALYKKFFLSHHAPSSKLAFFIEHYWVVSWDLRGENSYESEVLSYPSVHLVIEAGRSGVWGVVTGRFTRIIEGKGSALGIKFRPGAFYPFVQKPVSLFTDRVLQPVEIFGPEAKTFEKEILSTDNQEKRINLVESFLGARLPARDTNIELVNRIVDRIISDRKITNVDDLSTQFNINKRNLQRIFSQYVGVSPKWVINRFRLHEAAVQLAAGIEIDLPGLAFDLGYFDQPHFIKDFKKIIGKTPAEYMRSTAV